MAPRSAAAALRRRPFHKLMGTVVAFDFFVTMLLYFLVGAQMGGVREFLYQDIVRYDFHTSLFELLIFSFCRTVFLEVVYFLKGVVSGAPVLFTTATSTVYLIVKACLFVFANGTWLPELCIFASFVVPWLEALVWFVRNREIKQEDDVQKDFALSEQAPLLAPPPPSQTFTAHVQYGALPAAAPRAASPAPHDGYSTPPEDMAVDLEALLHGPTRSGAGAAARPLVGPVVHTVHAQPARAPASSAVPVSVPAPAPAVGAADAAGAATSAGVAFGTPAAPLPAAAASASAVDVPSPPAVPPSAPMAAPAAAAPAAALPPFLHPAVPPAYAQAAAEAMRAVLQMATEGPADGWQLFKEQDAVRMSRKEVPGLPVDFLKGEGVIAAPPTAVLQALGNLAERGRWDDMFEGGAVIREYVLGFDVAHLRFKGMFPVKGRDLCVLRGYCQHDDRTWVAFSQSVEHPDCPPPSGYVRAKLYPTGFVLRARADGGTDAVYVAAMDLMGSIPGAIKKKVALNIPLTVHKLRRYLTGGK